MTAVESPRSAGQNPVDEPITGNERCRDQRHPHAALAHFYHAFNERDLAAMGDNWSRAPEIAMSNPLGGIKRGWQEIGQVVFSVVSKVFGVRCITMDRLTIRNFWRVTRARCWVVDRPRISQPVKGGRYANRY